MTVLILYFTIYSVLGWICECVYCAAIDKVWVNRGFLNGPVCPVYGFGALFVIGLLDRFKDNSILLFIMAVVLTTALEYVTAVILERAFDLKWWDYSNYKLNYKGRICVLNSVIFGFLSLFLIDILNPFVVSKVSLLTYNQTLIASTIIVAIFIVDSVLTVISLVDMNDMLKKISQINIELKKLNISMEKFNDIEFNKVFNKLKSTGDLKGFKAKFEDTFNMFKRKKGVSTVQNRIMRAFPDMKSKMYGGEQFKKFKASIADYLSRKQN